MSRIGAIGAATAVEGFALAGALVFATEDDSALDALWDALDADVSVLILTARTAERLRTRFEERPFLLTVVMPQ